MVAPARLLLAAFAAAAVAACTAPAGAATPEPLIKPPQIVGGPCEYARHTGVATVTRVETIVNGTVQESLVEFDWAEDGSTAKPESLRLSAADLKDTEGKAVTPDFAVGSKHKLQLEKITKGTCTPRIWKYVGPAK